MVLASSIPISLLGTQQKLLPFTESSMVRLRSAEIYQSGTCESPNLNEYAFRFAVTQNFCPAGKFVRVQRNKTSALPAPLVSSTHEALRAAQSTCPSGTAVTHLRTCLVRP